MLSFSGWLDQSFLGGNRRGDFVVKFTVSDLDDKRALADLSRYQGDMLEVVVRRREPPDSDAELERVLSS